MFSHCVPSKRVNLFLELNEHIAVSEYHLRIEVLQYFYELTIKDKEQFALGLFKSSGLLHNFGQTGIKVVPLLDECLSGIEDGCDTMIMFIFGFFATLMTVERLNFVVGA